MATAAQPAPTGVPGSAALRGAYRSLSKPFEGLMEELRCFWHALEVMAVPSMVYMVGTRVWAAIITIIPLYLAALFSSYIATQAIVTHFFTLSSGTYEHYFHLFLPPVDILYSLIKAVIFAIAVT